MPESAMTCLIQSPHWRDKLAYPNSLLPSDLRLTSNLRGGRGLDLACGLSCLIPKPNRSKIGSASQTRVHWFLQPCFQPGPPSLTDPALRTEGSRFYRLVVP